MERRKKVKVIAWLFVTPWTIQSMEFFRPSPSPGDLPNPGIEPRSPTLQADSLTAEPQGKPKNTRVGRVAYPFSSGSSWQRNQIRVCCIAGRFFTSWAIREVLSGENLFITVRLGCRLCFEDGLKDNGSMYLTPGKGPWVTNHINKEKQNKTKKTETHLYPHAK